MKLLVAFSSSTKNIMMSCCHLYLHWLLIMKIITNILLSANPWYCNFMVCLKHKEFWDTRIKTYWNLQSEQPTVWLEKYMPILLFPSRGRWRLDWLVPLLDTKEVTHTENWKQEVITEKMTFRQSSWVSRCYLNKSNLYRDACSLTDHH